MVKYKSGRGQLLNGLKYIFQNLLLHVSRHGNAIRVEKYRQGAAAWHAMLDTFYYKLEIGE